MGEAHENALKEAETDATKRALSTFGNSFGLALYDREKRYVRKIPKKRASAIKKGDIVWMVISEGGTLTEYHDDPVAFCAAIRLNLENLTDRDQLQLFWEDNAATIEDLRKALPTLQTESEQHFADVLASIYSARLQAINMSFSTFSTIVKEHPGDVGSPVHMADYKSQPRSQICIRSRLIADHLALLFGLFRLDISNAKYILVDFN